MRSRRAAGAALVAVALASVGAGCGADSEPHRTTSTAARTTLPPRLTTTPAAGAEPELVPPLAFHVRKRAQLRLAPDGRMVGAIRTKTVFKSPTILAVANRKPGWVLVRTAIHGHHVGWLPESSGKLFSQPRSIVIDLSRKRLSVFHRDKLTDVYRVAIGARGTRTPVGKFGVSDRLRTDTPSGPYGCCILALTGRQRHIAQGWGGGDRIAIHATPATWTIGKAVSHGCVRASNATLHQLMRRIRLGTQVTIHR